jgi:hypothetical protein
MTPRDLAIQIHRLLQKQTAEGDELYVADVPDGLFSDVIVAGHLDIVKLSAELIGFVLLQRL